MCSVPGSWLPKRFKLASAALTVAASVLCVPPAYSLDPLDGSAGLGWWFQNDLVGTDDESPMAAAANGAAEVWWSRNWGIRGARHPYALGETGIDFSEHLSIDFKRRFLTPTDNGFLSLGAGWQSIDLDSGESSSGLRLTAEGRFGLGGVVSLYGQTSWWPELDDLGTHSNLEGQEFEAGLIYDPAPSLSLKLGFRRFRLGYEQGGIPGSAESEGVILGAGFKW